MIHQARLPRKLLQVFLLVVILSACSGPKPTPQLLPTLTATAPATATAAPSPSATATATQAPTLTVTPSPVPSPTPPGFILHQGAGISLTYPSSWEIFEQDTSRLAIGSPDSGIMFIFESRPGQEPGGVDNMFSTFQENTGEREVVRQGEPKTILLADGVEADLLQIKISSPEMDQDGWLIHSQQLTRAYHIFVIAPRNKLVMSKDTINGILQTVRLFDPQPFGLPRAETLLMLGSKTTLQELDPATAASSAASYVGLLFSGLVRLGPDLSILPDLAEKWVISGSGNIYTFTLRQGIAFSDGTPITAQDFADSWERACDPQTSSTTARTYLGDIVGVPNRLDGTAQQIAGITVIDARTLKVTLDAPKPYFLAKLTYPTAFVIDTRQASEDKENWVFSGHSSGPFMFHSFDQPQGYAFERNPHYWQPAGVAYLIFVEHPGGSPLSLYEEGTADIVGVGNTYLKEVSRPDHLLHAELQSAPSLCTDLIFFNPYTPPLDDPYLRQALIQATDRQALNEKLTRSTALLAHGVLPPAMPGARSDRVLPQYDPAAARASLAKSKYAGQALEITLISSGYADRQSDDVALLVDQWQKALGIKVKVIYLDPDGYTQAVVKQTKNVALYGWCADYPDPQNFLDLLFHSTSDFNIGGLHDAQIDRLLEQARIEPDPAKRIQLYQQIEDSLLEQGFVLPLYNAMLGKLVNRRVVGYILPPGQAQVLQLVTLK